MADDLIPKRIAERRVVGSGLVTRLLARRTFRPAGNSSRFWSRLEDDDPFLPGPPRAAVGPLSGFPGVTGAVEPGRSDAGGAEPRRLARPPPADRPAESSGGARPRSPDEVPRPRAAARPPPSSPPAPRATPRPDAAAPAEPVDRRPPIVPVNTPSASSPRGRLRMPAQAESPAPPPPTRSEAPPKPRENSIDDYVAYLGRIQALEAEQRAQQTEDAGAPSTKMPRRPTGGLDDLMGDTGEGRVRIPRPTRRRDEG